MRMSPTESVANLLPSAESAKLWTTLPCRGNSRTGRPVDRSQTPTAQSDPNCPTTSDAPSAVNASDEILRLLTSTLRSSLPEATLQIRVKPSLTNSLYDPP